MTFKEAKKACKKVGTSRASGEALAAMYADLIAFKWFAIGNPEKFYNHLRELATDAAITDRARELLRDHNTALDVVLA
jgi:tetraacyldisaccharide-1-P 4'-kinase